VTGHLSNGGWRKASASAQNGHCVEVTASSDGYKPDTAVLVRDSKHPDIGALAFTRAEWMAFIDGVRNGEFDLLWTAGSDPPPSSP
jgi:hypothetical protein